jgi:hypothetical protein
VTTLNRLRTGADVDRRSGEQLRRDGFLVIDSLVDADVVTELRAAYDDIISRRVALSGDRKLGSIIRQVMYPAREHSLFADNAAFRAGLDIARRVFGRDDLGRVYDMLIDKPAGTPHETPWHQDAAYMAMPAAHPGTPTDIDDIQVWLALDDVEIANGCMQFVPTPYGAPLLPHAVVSGDPEDEGRLLAFSEPFEASGAVAAPLRAGGCTVHLPSTPHYTGPNRTVRPRRAFIFNIGPITA